MRKVSKRTEQATISAANDYSEKSKDLYIIGIGASAGGLEALQDLISSLPSKLDGCAIIIAQHLSPTHKSMLVQLLSRNTGIQVKEAIHNRPISEGTIYITPPDKDIVIRNKLIELHRPYFVSGPKPSVDILFQSLAKNVGSKSIGVILSGTGSDGAKGIVAIKESGGLTIVQNPDTAKYNGMPNAAIESGVVDVILSPDLIGPELIEYIADPNLPRIHPNQEITNIQTPLGRIFAVLSKRAGIDFSNYKPATICRRLEKRIVELKKESLEEYVNYLEQNDPEASILFNSILIGVTTFFRDESAFEVLNQHLEKLLLSKKNLTPIRIWVPGCATGEEAYSIAILVQELMKQKGGKYHVQIFATDIDEQAIQQARKGVYPYSSVEHVPQEIKESYFLKRGNQYELIKSIRSMVLFSKHDVTSNPPFLKLDLISCRNLLIYFGNNLQKQIMPLFHYALLPDGYLFLGKSESVGQFSDLFAVLDHKAKLFQRKMGNALHAIKFNAFRPQRMHELPQDKRNLPSPSPTSLQDVVKETIFDQYDYPYIVLSETFDVIEVRGDVSQFVQIPQGTMNVGILKLIKEEYQIELRSMLNKVIKTKQIEKGSIRKMKLADAEIIMRMSVKSVQGQVGFAQALLLVFEIFELDSKSLSLFDGMLNKEIEASMVLQLEQELSSTKEHLQTYIEELETTNEELQSLNEEMQSTNEELQSSNEELETTNEELQSSNEEIQIAYTELKIANEELELKEIALEENKANVQALLNNSLQAFFLVDQEYKIIKFNEQAEKLILRLSGKACKVGYLIIDYFPSKSLDEFLSHFKRALIEDTVNVEMSLHTIDKLSLSHFKVCFNTVYHTRLQRKLMTIGILDVTEEKNAKDELIKNQMLTSSVFNAAAFGVCVTDAFGYFVDFNQEYTKIYGYNREELVGKHFSIVVPDHFKRQASKMHDDFIRDGFELPSEWQVVGKDGVPIFVYVKAELLVQQDGSRYKVTSIRDISDVKALLDRISQTHELAQVGSWEYLINTNEYIISPELQKILDIDPSVSNISKEDGDAILASSKYREELGAALSNLIENDAPFDIEFKVHTRGGKVKWIHSIALRKCNEFGEVVKVVGVSNDITKYKEAIEKVQLFSHTVQQSTRG
ncbi:MAG: PAS domain S-box protein, partial [Chitinophagaceae bacterium]|nr:PAS domain S-box protein [Chitinophagaceae bacterium]